MPRVLDQTDGRRRIGGRPGELLGPGQRHHRALRGEPEGVDVLQPLGLGDQLPVLAGQRRDGGDLVQPEPEQLLALRPLPGPGAPVRQVRGEFLPPRAECAVRLELVVEAGELVEHGALLTGAEQRDGLRLAVHRDQRIGQLGQGRQRDGPAAQVGAGAAVGTDGTHRDDGAVVVEPAARRCDRRRAGPVRLDAEADLHHGAVAAGPHPRGVAAPPGDQAQRGDDHRLARARLPRDDGETGMRLEHGVVDHAEVTDPQFVQHASHGSRRERHRPAAPRSA